MKVKRERETGMEGGRKGGREEREIKRKKMAKAEDKGE